MMDDIRGGEFTTLSDETRQKILDFLLGEANAIAHDIEPNAHVELDDLKRIYGGLYQDDNTALSAVETLYNKLKNKNIMENGKPINRFQCEEFLESLEKKPRRNITIKPEALAAKEIAHKLLKQFFKTTPSMTPADLATQCGVPLKIIYDCMNEASRVPCHIARSIAKESGADDAKRQAFIDAVYASHGLERYSPDMASKDMLRYFRVSRGIGRTDLARCIGVSKQALANWESGQSPITLQRAHNLIRAFEALNDPLSECEQVDFDAVIRREHPDAPQLWQLKEAKRLARELKEKGRQNEIASAEAVLAGSLDTISPAGILYNFRKAAGLSQAELASKSNISESNIMRLEKGEIGFTEYTIRSLSRVFEPSFEFEKNLRAAMKQKKLREAEPFRELLQKSVNTLSPGKTLSYTRKAAGMSQEELAAISGVEPSRISKLESGASNFTEKMIKSLAQAFEPEFETHLRAAIEREKAQNAGMSAQEKVLRRRASARQDSSRISP